jgi:energy-coupling factor transporter ATP-binding protein EcfA2
MPRINRIRIINFSYNNDSRHILDETFNFHGGENALLNLANGGGKSVLV